MTTETPAVSVCIPTYRGAVHLPETIDSILSQSFTDLELIVVDDASPDGTFDILRQFNDSRLRCYRNPRNLGPEGNWNRCLELARGRYVKLMPQDDVLYPGVLEKQVRILDQDFDGSIALVCGAREIIDAESRTLMARHLRSASADRQLTGQELIQACVRKGTNVIGEPGSVLLRRRIIDSVGKFSSSLPYVIDLDYWERCLRHGDGYYISQVVTGFRISGSSWSVRLAHDQSAQFRRFLSRINQESNWTVSLADRALGNLMTFVNNAGRILIYRRLRIATNTA